MLKKSLISIVTSLIAFTAFVFFVPADCQASAAGDIAINAENFPDDNFRSFVLSNYDTNSDSVLSADEIGAVTQMVVSSKSIQTLKGIEYFTALTKLN